MDWFPEWYSATNLGDLVILCCLGRFGRCCSRGISLPFDHISLEMIYRSLYHFSVARQKGQVTDPIKYFPVRENQDLGIVKQQRKPNVKLIVAPFPEQQRGSDQFFFKPLLQSP
jgi:hypothetical protein